MRTNATRENESSRFVFKMENCFLVEVVIVIVRDNDGINGRQFIELQNGWLKTLNEKFNG